MIRPVIAIVLLSLILANLLVVTITFSFAEMNRVAMERCLERQSFDVCFDTLN